MLYRLGRFTLDGEQYLGCSKQDLDYETAVHYAKHHNKIFATQEQPTVIMLIAKGRLVEFEGVDKTPQGVLY